MRNIEMYVLALLALVSGAVMLYMTGEVGGWRTQETLNKVLLAERNNTVITMSQLEELNSLRQNVSILNTEVTDLKATVNNAREGYYNAFELIFYMLMAGVVGIWACGFTLSLEYNFVKKVPNKEKPEY